MKKTFATILVAGSTLALSACDTVGGNIDTQPPYAMERTATHTSTPVAVSVATPVETPVVPAERVFQRAQTK